MDFSKNGGAIARQRFRLQVRFLFIPCTIPFLFLWVDSRISQRMAEQSHGRGSGYRCDFSFSPVEFISFSLVLTGVHHFSYLDCFDANGPKLKEDYLELKTYQKLKRTLQRDSVHLDVLLFGTVTGTRYLAVWYHFIISLFP
jgi:hypothetical protein